MKKGISADPKMLRGEPPLEYLAKANRLEREGKDIIRFEIGQPDFDSPENVRRKMIEAIDDGFTDYVPSKGIPELRKAIQADIERTRGFKPELDQILVLPGAKPGLYFSMMATVQRGDQVIYQDPCFFTYDSEVGYVGAEKVKVPLHEENDFRMDPEDIKKRVTKKTKMIILNSPQNPTSGVLKENDIKAIAEIAEDEDIYVLSDEVYSKMLYDGLEHHSPSFLDECSERTILVDGFSKAFSMTGYRLGYAVAPKEVVEEMTLLLADAISCTTSFVQKAGVEALKNSQYFVDEMMEEFSKRRDVLVKGLNEKVPGMSCIYPKGAFYAFPNVKKSGMSSEEIADHLLEEAGVCLLPGNKFGDQGEGFLRISYASSLESIEEGIERMSEAMEKKID